MLYYAIGIVLTMLVFLGTAVLLRWIARFENPTFNVLVPAQMHGLVVTESSGEADTTKGGGGNVVDIVHSIPGKYINKKPVDMMDWRYEDEDDEHVESRTIFYFLLGLQFIGLFRYLRLNKVRTFRWGRKDDENVYHMQAESKSTRYVFFSGQHDIDLKDIETRSMLKLNMLINVIYEETYPVRVRLRTADPYAVLTMKVTRLAIALIGAHEDPKALVQEKSLQDQLAQDIKKEVSGDAETELGLSIVNVTLADISFDEKTRTLLERLATAEKEAEANLVTAKNLADQEVAKAEGDKKARILRNDGDADRVERVIKPAAENPLTVRVREAEAYENNETVTTFAPGARTMVPLPSGQ